MPMKRFPSLLLRLARIQGRIESEHARPAPDWMTLMRLKLLRLRLKDRLLEVVRSLPRRARPARIAAR
jgi:hypothetical protein